METNVRIVMGKNLDGGVLIKGKTRIAARTPELKCKMTVDRWFVIINIICFICFVFVAFQTFSLSFLSFKFFFGEASLFRRSFSPFPFVLCS